MTPTADNHASGTLTDVVQIGVTEAVNFYATQEKAPLPSRQVSDEERQRLKATFVPPAHVDDAGRILTDEHVVVLVGVGAGRTFAGQWLLDGQGCTRIMHVNRARHMGGVRDSELRPGDGYLWDLSDKGRKPFQDWEFQHIRHLVEDRDCRLVIVLDDVGQVPRAAADCWTELKPPIAMAIAEAVVNQTPHAAAALGALHANFAETLAVDASPVVAVLAAQLAVRIAAGTETPGHASEVFHDGFDRDVADAMDVTWTSLEYTMMFAVALLENEPFEEVVAQQRKLDLLVRTSELPADRELRPRRTFHRPNDHLLDAIGARVERRANPMHAGLTEETVRFAQPGWAEAVLRRIWRHYHAEHDLLLGWMCGKEMADRHFEASVWALHTLVSRVPARDRAAELHRLAGRNGLAVSTLAAATLARLADTSGFATLATDTVAAWVRGMSANRKCAAVFYYRYRFDQSDPRDVLEQLAEIGRDTRTSVRNAVVATMLWLLRRPDHVVLVLRTVLNWADDPRSHDRSTDGLHTVALDVAAYLFDLGKDTGKAAIDLDVADLADRHRPECRRLVRWLLAEPERGVVVLSILDESVRWNSVSPGCIKEFYTKRLPVIRLLAPNLSWWGRRRAVLELCRSYPGRAAQIRRIFRLARRMAPTVVG
jgi:hypothetical protein